MVVNVEMFLKDHGATNCSKFMANISYSSVSLCVDVVKLVIDLNLCRRRLKCLLLLNPISLRCEWGVPTKPLTSKQSSSLHAYLLPWPYVLVSDESFNGTSETSILIHRKGELEHDDWRSTWASTRTSTVCPNTPEIIAGQTGDLAPPPTRRSGETPARDRKMVSNTSVRRKWVYF